MKKESDEIKRSVKERYASLAQRKASTCCSPAPSCCLPGEVSGQGLYTAEELRDLPESVLTLGCGNPTAIAELRPGEVVLDLGSGGGIDCFLSARRVAPAGKVIGLDMTPDMIQLARENAQRIGIDNLVEFLLGEMEHIPIEDNSVDVVISNCVINLSTDKDAVFREALRVLKPGGRLCISDIILLGELPEEMKDSLEYWAGCIAGSLPKSVYLDKIHDAGFRGVISEEVRSPILKNRGQDSSKLRASLNLGDKIASIKVRAFKPS